VFDKRFRSEAEKRLQPIGQNLGRTGVTANHFTVLGIIMATGAAVAIGAGALRAGLVLVVCTALPDVLDGAVAKASGTASPRGAFFDSVADRVTDALLLGGVGWYLASHDPGHIMLLPMAVLAASLVISYERAKAESLGFDAKGGLMERAERLGMLAIGLLFNHFLVVVLWVMLVLTLVTAGQRFLTVWRQAGAPPPATMERRPRIGRPGRQARTTGSKARRVRPSRRTAARPSRYRRPS